MHNTVGSNGSLGAEHLFVMRMLQLSSRRTALVKQRAEESADSSAMPMCQPSSYHDAGRVAKDAKNPIVVGTVLRMSGDTASQDGPCNAPSLCTPVSTATPAPANTRPRLSVEVTRSDDDAAAEVRGEGGMAVGEEALPASPTSSATAFSRAAEPVSPQSPLSPMRRMLELKGARPVRRPRGQDIIPPHRRSDSDGLNGYHHHQNNCGGSYSTGGSLSGLNIINSVDSSVGASHSTGASSSSRCSTARAALQHPPDRRTLSAIELQAAVGACATPQPPPPLRTATATPEDTRSAPDVPAFPTTAGRSAFSFDNANGAEETALTPTALPRSCEWGSCAAESTEAMMPSTGPVNNGAGGNGSGSTALAATAATTTAGAACRCESPTSPVVAQSFSDFLRRLCPISSSSPPVAPSMSNPLSYDTGVFSPLSAAGGGASAGTSAAGAAATATAGLRVDVEGGPRRGMTAMEYPTPLTDAGSSAFVSSGTSKRSTNLSALKPSLLPPPLPPYTTAPSLPLANLGAGTFTTAQELVACVRLAQMWTIMASRRWYHAGDNFINMRNSCTVNAPATPLTSPDAQLPPVTNRQPSGHISSSGSCSGSKSATGTAAAAATAKSVPPLLDGEATLVSDRVDAVLPTWAYLSSHSADAAPAAFMSVRGPERNPAGESGPPSSASSASRRSRHSHSSSLSSSLTSAAGASAASPHDTEGRVSQGRLDRQLCLFPYGLAEACALGHLRRRSSSNSSCRRSNRDGTAAGTTTMASSLHLLRLELMLHMLQIPPTVRTVSAEERRVLLEHALEEFAETGVLPTSVLRSVLNDAALRLLSSVDDVVLKRIAGDDEAAVVEVSEVAPPTTTADVAPPPCAKVVPLSLHVHTVQGELSTSVTSSPTMVSQLPLAPRSLVAGSFVHSAAASTISGETDSLWPISVIAAPAIPTQLILSVLVHVLSPQPLTPADSAEGKYDGDGRGPASATAADCDHPKSIGERAPTRDAALGVAEVVLQHLFPISFVLSRYATRLSLSSAVDYEALGSGVDGNSTPVPAEETPGTEGKEGGDAAAAAAAAPQQWNWVDVDLAELRAACGVMETPAPPPEVGSPNTKSRTRRSKKQSGSSPHAMVAEAAADESAFPAAGEDQQPPPSAKQPAPQQTEGRVKSGGDEEGVDIVSVSECPQLLRWDVAKETADLTATTEAMEYQLRLICGHAQLVWQFMKDLDTHQDTERRKAARRGQTKSAKRPKPTESSSYAEEMQGSVTAMTTRATMLLMDATIRKGYFLASAGCPPASGKEDHDCGRSTSSSAHALHKTLSAWFSPYAAHLAKEVCGPLERLESAFLASTSSTTSSPAATTVASVGVAGETTGSASDGAASTLARHVVGAQVALKETRRHRRSAAAAARQSHTTKRATANAGQEGDASAVSPLLPALGRARAMVQLCQEVADTTDTSAAFPKMRLVGGGDGEEDAVVSDPLLFSLCVPTSQAQDAHQRFLSTSSTASVRVLETSSAAQPLQEHITRLQGELQRVLEQLERSQRFWATLPASLKLLQGERSAMQDIIGEEAAARQRLRSTCAAAREAAQSKVQARLTAEASQKEAAAAAQQQVPSEKATTLRHRETDKPVPPAQVTTAVAAVSAVEGGADTSAETQKIVSASPPPPPTPTPTVDAQAEGGEGNVCKDGKVGVEARMLHNAGMHPTTPSPEAAAFAAATTKRSVPSLSISAADTQSHAPLRTPQNASKRGSSISKGGNNKGGGKSGTTRATTAGATTALSSPKSLRNRTTQQSPHSPAAQSSATPASFTDSAVGTPSITSPHSGASTSPKAASSGSTFSSAAAAVGSATQAAPRPAPQESPRGLFVLYVDVALMRQAAPFVAIGAVLFFLFLLL
jgi:hypothetical protein